MNIINIALKEIKTDFRDVKTLVFLLAFPIVLMLILGTALSNAFNTTTPIDDIHVLYKVTAGEDVSQSFQSFAKGVDNIGVHFVKATNDEDGKAAVKENKYDGFIEVSDSGIKLYESNRNSIKGSIIQGMLASYADKFNVVSAVSKTAPNQVGAVMAYGNNKNYIKETSLNSKKQPGSMDYYAIAMTTMIALYGAMSASYLIRGERMRKTDIRLIAAPITKADIFLGKLFGSIVTSALCSLIVILFSKYVFNVYWGNHLGVVFLVVLTEILLATSIGLGISYITKTEAVSKTLLMIVIQVCAFFGGAYFPIEASGITRLSPLTWANHAITKVIYSNNLVPALHTALLNIGIAALFLVIAIVSLQRREGL